MVATVNADDPPLFNWTLNEDVVALHNNMSMSVDNIDAVLLDAVGVCVAPDAERAAWEVRYAEEMSVLPLAHFG